MIQQYNFKEGLPHEFEIIELANFYKKNSNILTQTHRVNFYQIIWFEEGNGKHLVDFQPVKIENNTLLFLNKNVVHQFDKMTTFKGKTILFTDNFFCRDANDASFLKNTILFNDLFEIAQIQIHNKHLIAILNLMSEEITNTKDFQQANILRHFLHSFLLIAERERRKQNFVEMKKGVDFDYLLLFKDLLEAHFYSKKQVSYYASKLAVTEKRLNQVTANRLGKTPKQIIDERVILEAKRLLVYTNQSIKEVGFFLGFEEPTNFIKYFKKHTKTTPVEFREKKHLA